MLPAQGTNSYVAKSTRRGLHVDFVCQRWFYEAAVDSNQSCVCMYDRPLRVA